MLQNLRYAIRMMRKAPGFTAVAILTLGLGTGANTAIFSVVNALVLRPLALKDPARVMVISVSNPARGFRGSVFSLANYDALRDRARSFAATGAFCFDSLTLTGGAEPEQLAVSPTDPVTFAAIALLFLIVSAAACLAPAWRATRIAPVNALRAG